MNMYMLVQTLYRQIYLKQLDMTCLLARAADRVSCPETMRIINE